MSARPSVHPYGVGVNIFKTLRLRDRWAHVDETWHVYSVGPGTKLIRSEILDFRSLRRAGEMTPSRVLIPVTAVRGLYRNTFCRHYATLPDNNLHAVDVRCTAVTSLRILPCRNINAP